MTDTTDTTSHISASAGAPPDDVLVVGYGPVGQLLAGLLAAEGCFVTAVERWPEPYPMPRAVSFDSESRRILTRAGIGADLDEIAEPSGEYVWSTASGETLLEIPIKDPGHCGWPDSTSMYQPGVEAGLDREARARGVHVARGETAERIEQDEDEVRLWTRTADGTVRVRRARHLVGCDGANSLVRGVLGTGTVDVDFSDDWLICDVRPHEPRRVVPNNRQVCDPERPTTVVSAGPGHRRYEFMRVPGESREELDSEATAWRLLEPHGFHPGNSTLERHAVYTFRARHAETWRSGRLLIAGDAAHVMPPFAGQGMCSGFRDAANLAWKLAAVAQGRAGEALLDTYEAERRDHVQHAIGMSLDLAQVICQTDRKQARARDTMMLASRRRGLQPPQPKHPVRPLSVGDGLGPLAGELMPQFRVGGDTGADWFDAVAGYGPILLLRPDVVPSPATADLATQLGVRVVRVRPAGSDEPDAASDEVADVVVTDVDGGYLRLLDEAGVAGVLVRPDFYAFGGAEAESAVEALLVKYAETLSGKTLATTRS